MIYNRGIDDIGVALKALGTDNGLDFSDGASWDLFIKAIAANHNNKWSSRIGMSPNQVHDGQNIRLPIDANTELVFMDSHRDNAEFYNKWIVNMKNMAVNIAKLNLEKYDKRRKEYYDKGRYDEDFKVGEPVLPRSLVE